MRGQPTRCLHCSCRSRSRRRRSRRSRNMHSQSHDQPRLHGRPKRHFLWTSRAHFQHHHCRCCHARRNRYVTANGNLEVQPYNITIRRTSHLEPPSALVYFLHNFIHVSLFFYILDHISRLQRSGCYVYRYIPLQVVLKHPRNVVYTQATRKLLQHLKMNILSTSCIYTCMCIHWQL